MSSYPQRKIGDANVSAQGLGCMGMAYAYTSFGGIDEKESIATLTAAADAGVTFWDTSDIYGPHTNEKLLGKWFKDTGRRNEIFLATKFALKDNAQGQREVHGDPAYVKQACHDSLSRLGVDTIDLYYQHRVDPNTPIEHTVSAMAELVNEGKVRYLGLSECSARTLRRAHAVHPIAAIQMEYSPFALDIEAAHTGILAAARELGVKIVAYSPLSRGFLTGAIKSPDDFAEDDFRRRLPRFSGENFAANMRLVDKLAGVAARKGVTPGQLSLAWVLAQGEDFIPIPGTKRVRYLEENAAAVEVRLTEAELKEIRSEVEKAGGGRGERYPPALHKLSFGDSPELE